MNIMKRRPLLGVLLSVGIVASCGNAAQMFLGQASSGSRTPIALTISASSNTPYNIFSNKGGSYAAGNSDITLTVNGGVTQGSNSTATAAIDTGTGWTAGDTLKIVVSGTVEGMGGAGGAGQNVNLTTLSGGAVGSAGGPAINLQFATTLQGSGVIGGGGGGGGGGAADWQTLPSQTAGGGGGGGGAGGAGGAAGALGAASGRTTNSNGTAGSAAASGSTAGANGGPGGLTAGGSGGSGGAGGAAGVAGGVGSVTSGTGATGGGGGGGGGIGAAGGPGESSSIHGGGGFSAGAAGNAVTKNGNTLTNSFAGTTYGSII